MNVLVLASVLLAFQPVGAQTVPKRPVNSVSSIRVDRGKSEIDGKHWAMLTVVAKNSYRGWIATWQPTLQVVCRQDGKFLILNSGPMEGGDYESGLTVETRIKFDDTEPAKYYWAQRRDRKSYQFMYEENRQGGMDQFLDAKTVLIEIHPFMTGNLPVVRFDVRGLRAAFEKSAEWSGAE